MKRLSHRSHALLLEQQKSPAQPVAGCRRGAACSLSARLADGSNAGPSNTHLGNLGFCSPLAVKELEIFVVLYLASGTI